MPKRPQSISKPTVSYDKIIGSRITIFRKEKRLTQVELAELIGITQSVLARYESGLIRISADMIPRLAKALEVTTDELFDFNSTSTAPSPSLKLIRRFRKIESLPPEQQSSIIQSIDGALKIAEQASTQK